MPIALLPQLPAVPVSVFPLSQSSSSISPFRTPSQLQRFALDFALIHRKGLVVLISLSPRAGGHLKEQDHGLPEGFEVVDVVQSPPVLHVHEEGHAEDGEDEHDEEQQ